MVKQKIDVDYFYKIQICNIHLLFFYLQPFQTPLYCFFSLNNGVTVRAQRIKHTSSVDLIECQSVHVSIIAKSKWKFFQLYC